MAQPLSAASWDWGPISGRFSNKLSAGATVRTQHNDKRYIGRLNVDGQQFYCDPGQPIDYNPSGLPVNPIGNLPDPVGNCSLAGFSRFIQGQGSTLGHPSDDGSFNYDRYDTVAAAFKLVSKLSLSYENFLLVTQGIMVLDPVNSDFTENHPGSFFTCAADFDGDPANDGQEVCGGQPQRTARPTADEDDFARSARLEVAYLSYGAELFEQSQEFRIGRQRVAWGETLTLPLNSIDSINPPDAVRLTTPGFDLPELFDPVSMVFASTTFSEAVSVEGLYLLDWTPLRLPAPGTFFAPSDVVGLESIAGRRAASLGLGISREDPSNLFDRAMRADINPDDFGRDCLVDPEGDGFFLDGSARDGFDDQFGNLNQGAHRGAMVLSADEQGRPGLRPVPNESPQAYNRGRQACFISSATPDPDGQFGFKLNYYAENLGGAEFGFHFLRYHSRLPYVSPRATQLPAQIGDPGAVLSSLGLPVTAPTQVVTLLNGSKISDTQRFRAEYPEDIELYGISVNTNISSVSVAAEYVYRPNMPLQITPLDLSFFAQSVAFRDMRCVSAPSLTEQYRFGDYAEFQTADCPAVRIGPGDRIQGFERFPMGQGSVSLLNLPAFNPFGADQWIQILDIGFSQVFGLPDTLTLPISSAALAASSPLPGRREIDCVDDGSGGLVCDGVKSNGFEQGDNDDILAAFILNPQRESKEAFATAFSWGYRFINLIRYEGVAGGNVQLSAALFHDVNGNAPSPVANFLEGRKQMFFGVRYQRGAMRLDSRYTWFTGNKRYNRQRDRDNLSFAVTYSF